MFQKIQKKTFVAEVSQDETTNKTIIQNFKSQKEGKAVQLGTLLDLSEFKSLNALVSEKEMQELVKRIGYPPILLTDISVSINSLKGDNSEDVEHLANSIYLPKVGNSPVVASLSELKIKPKNYYQIQLDETKANSIYVANYFNTAVGKKLRESLEAGAVIPQISKSQLSKCIFFLPDLATQADLIEVDNKIQQFSFRLDELKRNLWKQPKHYKSIAKELKTINQEEKLENWIDKLLILGKDEPDYKQEFLGKIFGRIALNNMIKDEKPFDKNIPTSRQFKAKELEGDLETEKSKWIELLYEYQNYNNPKFVHDFFGKMTNEQIGILVYKHTDHHLRQFGV